ncbi:hypothetical protein AB6A23_07335 [Paenibacillus tarimensis]
MLVLERVKMSIQGAEQRKFVRVYLLAGVATSPQFFNTGCETVGKLCEQSGWRSTVEVLFPYGDNTRGVISQVSRAAGDLSKRFTLFQHGGRHAANSIRKSYVGEPLILIGHSGGGAAAYQAIRILHKEQKLGDFRIVQLGSPKVPICPDFRNRVYYAYVVDEQGRRKDPVAKLGTWGGWSAGRFMLPRWDRYKYAPGHIEELRLLGGHADYFRHGHPYVDKNQVSNLDKTLGRVWKWLQLSLFCRSG